MEVYDSTGRRMTWICRAKDRLEGDNELKSAGTKKIIREKVDSLRTRLQKLLKDNEEANDLEKLEQEEFIIDLNEDKQRKDNITAKVKSHLTEIQSQIEINKKIAKEIREQHLEVMMYKYHSISDLSSAETASSSCFPNFPVRYQTEAEKRTLKIVKLLRTNEITEMQRNINRTSQKGKCWSTHIYNNPGRNPNYIFDVSMSSKKKSTNQDYISDDDEDFIEIEESANLHVSQMLYPPLAIRSNYQRITQQSLMQHNGRGIAICFNEQFMNLKNEKDAVMTQINADSERITEITKELGCTSTFKGISSHEDISPETYDMPEKNFNNESSHNKINIESMTPASKRALMDMMNGTLEVKTVVSNKTIDPLPLLQRIYELN
jgi:hypothetical protein